MLSKNSNNMPKHHSYILCRECNTMLHCRMDYGNHICDICFYRKKTSNNIQKIIRKNKKRNNDYIGTTVRLPFEIAGVLICVPLLYTVRVGNYVVNRYNNRNNRVFNTYV